MYSALYYACTFTGKNLRSGSCMFSVSMCPAHCLSLMLHTGLPGAVDSAVRDPLDLTRLRPQVVQLPHPLHSVGFCPDAASPLLPDTGI